MPTQADERPRLSVAPVDDFEISGTGEHSAWRRSDWTALRRRQPDGHPYESRFKMLYSTTGLYFLMDGADRKLTASMDEDFMDLWKEDVFEEGRSSRRHRFRGGEPSSSFRTRC